MGSLSSKGNQSSDNSPVRRHSVQDSPKPRNVGGSPQKVLNAKYATDVGSPLRNIGKNNHEEVIPRGKNNQIASTPANSLIENVFLLSLGEAVGDDLPERSLFIKETASKCHKLPLLNAENLKEAVWERLHLSSSVKVVIQSTTRSPRSGPAKVGPYDEPCAFKYLYHCFVRWKSTQREARFSELYDEITKCREAILGNAKTCLYHPKEFADQQIYKQFIDVCTENKDFLLDQNSMIHEFLLEVIGMLESEPGCLTKSMAPVLTYIQKRFRTEFTLMHVAEIAPYLLVLRVFTFTPSVAQVFMEFNRPEDWSLAKSYEATLLGSILSLNPCPKNNTGPYEFFSDPLDMSPHDVNTSIVFIWQRLNDICADLHKILMAIIRMSEELRHQVLEWLASCLQANRGKPDLWCAHEAEVFDSQFCSDGFFLNLCHVMLQMCQPFSVPNSDKLLKIKPSYTRANVSSEEDRKRKCVHARGLASEAPFVPYTDTEQLAEAESYHFISECFFLTQQALHIGYNIVFKLLKLNSSVARMKKLYEEIKEVYPKKVVGLVRLQLSKEICWYLNIKAAVTEYHLTKMCLSFHIATATWLVQVASRDDVTDFQPIKLPLDSLVPKTLSYLPQYIITNFAQFIIPLEVFKGLDVMTTNAETLQHFMTLVLVFMGSPERLRNSDVRAQLAEALEAVIPTMKDDGTWEVSKSGLPEQAFKEHPLIEHLAETVLHVFVSIEMTGQTVEDEKKFSYRRSMHKILQYMWKIPVHKAALKRLSEEAVAAIDNVEPPLFLRFINLLVNDAIFLLDEALDHMKQIRSSEIERDSGEWQKLSAEQFRDKETGLRHLGMMGRYRNIMANHTIYTLEILTRDIGTIFCHNVMVDRIAGMLNYFLEHLVGPKQRDYKVKDRREYEFRPEQIVSDIAHICVYLGRDENFCKAVLGETRSFSHSLFSQAVVVLNKIGVAPEFIVRFNELGEKLQTLEGDYKREEEVLADAPEEFLDPIMGTLMVDPVTLPTSNTSIDRAVIWRHLLSDQRDPFTNLPLSMEMITPNTELKTRIEEWKQNNLQQKSKDSAEKSKSTPPDTSASGSETEQIA